MTDRPVPWLPVDCLHGAHGARRAGGLVDAWSRKWLAGESWQALGTWAGIDEYAGPDDGGQTWAPLREGPRARLHGAPKAVLRLALAMLGERGRTNFSRRDLAFFRRLAGQALDDLVDTFEATIPGSDALGEQAGDETSMLRIGPVGEPLLAIEAARASLVLLARQDYPRHALPPPDTRGAAWAALSVPVAARLGTATIALAQLDTLELGDVIVLDRAVDAPATLLVADRDTALACSLARHASGLALKLESTP